MGPLPETERGSKYVLVVADYYTKWVEVYDIPNQEATTVAVKLFGEMFCRFSSRAAPLGPRPPVRIPAY